jgi:hypothetical protein
MEKSAEQVAQELMTKLENVDKQGEAGPDERLIPHQAIVSLTAVITQQMPNGAWYPRTTIDEQFLLIVEGTSEKEVVDDLKAKLQELREQWEKSGGKIGRHRTSPTLPMSEQPSTS